MPGMPFTLPMPFQKPPYPNPVNNRQALAAKFDAMTADEIEDYLASGQASPLEMPVAESAIQAKRAAPETDNNLMPDAAQGTPAPTVQSEDLPPLPAAMSPSRQAIADMMAKNTGQVSDQDKWLALATAGAAMAASPSKYPLQAIGQGALTGFQNFRQAQQQAARDRMAAVAQSLSAEKADEEKRANQATERYRTQTADETKRQNLEQERLRGRGLDIQEQQNTDIKDYRDALLGQGDWSVAGRDADGHAVLVNKKDGSKKTTDFDPAKLNSSSLERLVDNLQKENPELSYSDALEIASGRESRRTLAASKLELANADQLRKFEEGWYKRNQLVQGSKLTPDQERKLASERAAFAAKLPKVPGAKAQVSAGGDETPAPKTPDTSAAPYKTPPAVPADREIGKIYATPKGPMKWTAGGWVPQ